VWYTQKNAKTTEQMLEVLFHKASRLITGLFHQKPTVFVKKSSGLIPFSNIHIRQSHSYVLKALTYPLSHPLSPILKSELTIQTPTYPSPIKSFLFPLPLLQFNNSPLEIISLTLAPPWVPPVCQVQNINLTQKEAVEAVPQQLQQEKDNG
jgi:hypothetical protein